MYVTIKHTTGLNITDAAVNSHRWQLWSLFVCLVILCHFSALSAFIYVVFAVAYFEIKAVFSIKHALRCFSPSYGSVSFSLTVAMVLWLNQELVYWPKSDRKTQKTTRSSPFTRLSVPHRAPTAALSGGEHWINVRARFGPATNIAHKGDNNEEDGDGDDIAAQRPCGADTTNAVTWSPPAGRLPAVTWQMSVRHQRVTLKNEN